MGYLTWWAVHTWGVARDAVGDQALAGTPLGKVLGDHLARTCTDDRARDRAVRLQHPDTLLDDIAPTGRTPVVLPR